MEQLDHKQRNNATTTAATKRRRPRRRPQAAGARAGPGPAGSQRGGEDEETGQRTDATANHNKQLYAVTDNGDKGGALFVKVPGLPGPLLRRLS